MLDAEDPTVNATASTPGEESTVADAQPTATGGSSPEPPAKKAAKRAPAKKAVTKKATAKKATAKKVASSPAKRTAKKAEPSAEGATGLPEPDAPAVEGASAPAQKAATKRASGAKKAATKRTSKKAADAPSPLSPAAEPVETATAPAAEPVETATAPAAEPVQTATVAPSAPMLLFQAPEPTKTLPRRRKPAEPKPDKTAEQATGDGAAAQTYESQTTNRQGQQRGQGPDQSPSAKKAGEGDGKETKPSGAEETQDLDTEDDIDGEGGSRSRRRRRGGRRRRKPGDNDSEAPDKSGDTAAADSGERTSPASDADNGSESGNGSDGDAAGTHRRRRRRRSGDDSDNAKDDPQNTVTRVRKPRAVEDEITSLTGSTRLEAKKQRRKEGREAGRRRAPIASEAEFLARREAVERVMVIRQRKDLTQIAVLEDKVLVEHYVARDSQTSLIGNVYLGRVQNVLPSMEAAFIDIGKGRNAVIYAGEVNWDALGAKGGGQRKIEQVLKSGQSVLVQVSKDPIGHKGARLTSQISIPGRFLVYVPDGTTSGISRKLPDTERTRLKTLLKEIVPDSAGVIVRTAAEGASEEELTHDVERLTARWEDIQGKVAGGNAPQLLYGEPDLTLRVVRDLFTEDFAKLVVSGSDAWDVVDGYVKHIAPDLEERLERYDEDSDVFADFRIDEQIAKGLDRKAWLPSGGSLVVDRTEAMTVVDVNTGKFTGSGGNLEETVTRNNLEAAEEIVRQLRLRDIGGIIVIDFIDMVLESNRDLVLRRMVECLGRDRTRHQVAEVTSLGLVQMTRKRIGTGLLEAFSETCEHCQGRGVLVHQEPIDPKSKADDEPRRNRRSGRNRGREDANGAGASTSSSASHPSPKDVAAVAKPENADRPPLDGIDAPVPEAVRSGPEEAEVDQPDAVQPDAVQPDAVQPAAVQPAAVQPAAVQAEVDQPDAVQPDAVQSDANPAEDQHAHRDVDSSAPPVSRPADAEPKPMRQRKRAARREAGPAATPDGSTALVVVPDPHVADQPAGVSGPVADTSDGDAPPPPAAASRIVTSVRRRGAASRAAGPPAAGAPQVDAASVDAASLDAASVDAAGTDDGVASEPDSGEDSVALSHAHVPVKKKGSRNH